MSVTGGGSVAYTPPRPLYNLDKLAASPDGPVWLFEGPRKADRAEACLPGGVTTANAGGASAIKQTDLSPLRGRDVILWRDSDEAGAKWQEQMIAALRAVERGVDPRREHRMCCRRR